MSTFTGADVPPEEPTTGTITIAWRVVDSAANDAEDRYDWQYSADPPISDEMAEAILHEAWKRI